jgi:hypothetical protein
MTQVDRPACPPEDCGGIAGFQDLVEAINGTNHEQHRKCVSGLLDQRPSQFRVAHLAHPCFALRHEIMLSVGNAYRRG